MPPVDPIGVNIAAHFRELSQEFGLVDPLLERLDDTDPVVQMQATKGLWRWWYWRADEGLIGKASAPLRLTKKSSLDVEELAFFHLGEADRRTSWEGRLCGESPMRKPRQSR